MSQRLDLTTGDVTAQRQQPWHFSIAFDRAAPRIDFEFDDATGSIPAEQWDALIQQVQRREPGRWQSGECPPPLGGSLRAIAAKLRTTATYQLFLAGFEAAQLLGITKHDWDVLLQLGPLLSDLYTHPSKRGGLYFAPEDWYERQNAEAIDELVQENKIGRLVATSSNGNRFETVYVPYATPIVDHLSPQARSAWDELREFYNRAVGRV